MPKLCLNDNCYNITKQLAKKLEFLSHVSKYIEDAQKNGDEKTKTIWETIRTDEEKHTGLLRDLLIAEVKGNKL
jgi:rubrerythrin